MREHIEDKKFVIIKTEKTEPKTIHFDLSKKVEKT